MTESRPARRRGVLRSLVSGLVMSGLLASGLAVVLLGVAAGPADAASASLGSVPADVTAYVSNGGLVARLDNVYGPDASGTKGIDFGATTKAGPISRVYEWTAVRLANRATDHPVQLTNNWVVPITIGDKSVGLATIWINPQTVQPELAEFTPDAALGTALTTVPATAALVRDTATGAWLALDAAKVTPLVAGTSGLTTPAPVASLKLTSGAAAPITSAAEPNTGLALAIGLVGLIVVVIVVALLVPRGRRARTSRKAAARELEPGPEPSPEPEPEPEPVSAKASAVATKTQPKVAAAKAPVAKSPVVKAPAAKPATPPPSVKPATPKPSGARPGGRTPTNSAASKPASSKPNATNPGATNPGATRPSASKPPASKPPTAQPPTPRPLTPKPPTPKPPTAKQPSAQPPTAPPPTPKQPPRPRTPRPKPPASDSGPAADS